MDFSSKIKTHNIFVVPILVLVIGLLVPQIHWILALAISLIFFISKFPKLVRIEIIGNRLQILYPFNPFKNTLAYDLATLNKVVYVDRKKAVRGSYPHSHINLYRDGENTRTIKVILNKSEVENLKSTLNSYQVEFDYTTQLQVEMV